MRSTFISGRTKIVASPEVQNASWLDRLFLLLFAPQLAQAAESALDRYASCLIASAAVALDHQSGSIDPAKATAEAYEQCRYLRTEDETGRLDAFVSKAVEAIAAVAKQ